MGRFFGLASFLSLLAAAPLSAATTLNVYVRNSSGTAIPSVQVAAIHFSSNGPDPINSRLVAADGAGLAAFTGGNALVDNLVYDITASSQGFLPSVRDQFNSPTHPSLYANPPLLGATTIYISSFNAVNVGEIDADVANFTPNALIFGSIQPAYGQFTQPLAFGMGTANGGGTGKVHILNVPYSSSSTYNVQVYDPVQNKGVTRIVDTELAAYRTSISSFSGSSVLDFANSIPPITTVNTAQQSGAAGGLSVDGVVTDTNSLPISYIGLNFQGRYIQNFSTGTDFRWANADQNGRFQLFGLIAGVTYYAQIQGGCFSGPNNPGGCYGGYNSTASAAGFGAAPASNDFLYPSTSTVLTQVIRIPQAVGSGSGKIAVYVQDSAGNPIPQAYINVSGDNMSWETSGACAGNQPVVNPGLANVNVAATTGYVLVTGLPSGNFQIQAFTQFNFQGATRYNDGPNGVSCWNEGAGGNGCQCGTDDYRVTVSTALLPGPDVTVFNSSGVQVGAAAASLILTVKTAQNTSGRVAGTLTFPSSGIDLSTDPITITVQSQCQGAGACNPTGNIAFFNAPSTGPTINYSIAVASGQAYFMQVTSNYWGVVRANGGDQSTVDLTSTSVATQNLTFARAGRITGKLNKPDGSVFQPAFQGGSGAWLSANGVNVSAWNGASVNQDGSFIIGGLLPGNYELRVFGYGTNFTYSNRQPLPTASVTAQLDSYTDVNMAAGDEVLVRVATASLPRISLPVCTGFGFSKCPDENFEAFALPAGTPFAGDALNDILIHSDDILRFPYIADPTHAHDCDHPSTQPGFCVRRVPAPAAYDFYLTVTGDFADKDSSGVRPFLTLLTSSRNVVVNDLLANTTYWSGNTQTATTTVRVVDLTPSSDLSGTGFATLAGAVTAANAIRPQDFALFGGDMGKFVRYIPTITLFDASGQFRATGLATPNPTCFSTLVTSGPVTMTASAFFEQALASGNFPLFQQIFNQCGGPSYEIRGISTGTYAAVVTSPNYPPCQATAQLLAAGTTVQLPFNLDTCAGGGASLYGVVTSTKGVAIAGASISAGAPNYKTRTIASGPGGAYAFQGLPSGSYKMTVSAAGFALNAALVDVSGPTAQNFSMRAGGATITGTVYAQRVPFTQTQPGAQILAYNDTYNAGNPAAELPLYKTVTSSSGFYRLDGLEAGQTYKVFVRVPGMLVLSQSTKTISGVQPFIDFNLLAKPPDVQVSGRPSGVNYEFTINNPSDFKTGRAWVGLSPFVKATSTEVSNSFQFLPNNQIALSYPLARLTAGADYAMHIEAVSLTGLNVIKEVTFGTSRPASAVVAIDDKLLGDDSDDGSGHLLNQASIDASGGNASALSIPVGSMIPISSGAAPAVQFSAMDASASTLTASAGLSTAAYAGPIYHVALSSINYTQKGVDLQLAYNKANTNIGDAAVFHFNTGTGKWESVPGLQTLDPVKGVIRIRRIRSVASVLGLKNGHPGLAVASVNGFAPSAEALANGLIPDDVGDFTILRPSLVGTAFAGSTLKVFNFPNPFNLSTKTLPVNNGGALTQITTSGTIIKYELPNGISGDVVIRIYTIAGELVQELDQGVQQGGFFYYTGWDGKNRKGQSVANGVYYGILSVPGTKVRDGTFKMAVIK